MHSQRLVITLILFSFFASASLSQSFFVPADTLHKKRFNTALAFSATTYTAFSIGLYNTWYKKYPQQSFHLFNDFGEWEHMDKIGHLYTAYFQGVLCYKGAKWSGLNKKNSIITGIVCGTIFQTTIEVMDGFSSKWGFSLTDVTANITGITAFALQQHYWNDQRITLKESYIPVHHSTKEITSQDQTTLSSPALRAASLFGSNYFESYLKDYNGQTYWASVNVHSFLNDGNKWPQWLNVAFGYGAENMYGGYKNEWEENGVKFKLNDKLYPRYHQFFLGFDIDLPKLHPKQPFLKTLCSVFNIFKIPSPALEINTLGEIKFHLLR